MSHPTASRRRGARLTPAFATPVLALLFAFTSPPSLRAQPELPPPEATEQWQPVPPRVATPAGAPPSDARVLFDGTSLAAWEPERPGSPGWELAEGAMTVGRGAGSLRTRAAFGDVQLHVEFRCPADDTGTGQDRGNSGIFLMGLYEVQVLDNHDNTTYVNGQAASIYKQHPPLANACRPAGEWQSYDIVFIAPRFAADGMLRSPARCTVLHNGVLVQHDVVLHGPTTYQGEPRYTPHAARLPLLLQDHGDRVAYRNVWVRELTLPE